jgi:AcrR family transcriptional regulator
MRQTGCMAIETRSSSPRIRGNQMGDRGDTNDVPNEDRRKRKGARTQQKILFTAGRHFARRGYSAVTLRDIAEDVGVTPAMIVRYFGSKQALFEAVAHVEPDILPVSEMPIEELARMTIEYWQDPDLRTPAIALLRSLELDGGELFRSELRHRVVGPLSDHISGEDADVRLRLATGLVTGFGLFGLGTLLDPDQAPLPDDEIKRFLPYLTRLLAVCLEPPEAQAASTL